MDANQRLINRVGALFKTLDILEEAEAEAKTNSASEILLRAVNRAYKNKQRALMDLREEAEKYGYKKGKR